MVVVMHSAGRGGVVVENIAFVGCAQYFLMYSSVYRIEPTFLRHLI